jgi:hypothetical protein
MEKREQDAWQVVCDLPRSGVRRFAVPGGWLYQVEDLFHDGTENRFRWGAPVFVPDARSP